MEKLLFSAAVATGLIIGISLIAWNWLGQSHFLGPRDACASTEGTAVAVWGLTLGVGRASLPVTVEVILLHAFSSVAGATFEP